MRPVCVPCRNGGGLNFSSDALGHTITANNFTPGGRWTKVTDQNGVQRSSPTARASG